MSKQLSVARRATRGLVLAAALFAPDTALAAGSADLVDDSEVETPGDCNLEAHGTGYGHDAWEAVATVACTPEAVPMLELGVFAGHSWMPASMMGEAPATNELVVGIAPKLNLRPASKGLGLALNGLAGYGVDRSRLEYAALTAVVTLPASDSLNLNFNAGWGWTAAGTSHELFVGAQAEWTVSEQFILMAEGFTRDYGKAGGQAGVRWTTGGGRIDLDLLAGRYLDGETPTSLTAGVTVRW